VLPVRREVIIVLGKTGYGKSWWSKLAVAESARLVVYDPLMAPEYRVEWDDGDLPRFADRLDEFRAEAKEQASFRLGVYDRDHVASAGSYAFAWGACTLLVEEASTVWEKAARLGSWDRRLVFLGRHRAVNFIVVAQRAMSIPIDIRSQANRIISFAQHEGDDLSWLEDFYGPDVVDEIPALPRFECFDYHNGDTVRYSIRPEVKRVFNVTLDSEGNREGVTL
jgi:hypothetical protein